jgi:hypothetical protein
VGSGIRAVDGNKVESPMRHEVIIFAGITRLFCMTSWVYVFDSTQKRGFRGDWPTSASEMDIAIIRGTLYCCR